MEDQFEIKEEEGKFAIYEKGRTPIKLETCDSKEEAEEAIKQWKARDQLDSEIDDFASEKVHEYAGILERSEVLQMIREYGSN